MGRKPSKLDVVLPKRQSSAFQVTALGVDPAVHAEFQKEALAVAREGAAKFPGLVQAVLNELRVVDPVAILACFASYGLQVRLGQDGREIKALPDIHQHHAEILQALLLTLPATDWGKGVLLPQALHSVLTTVPKLSEAFFAQRIVDSEAIKDDHEKLAVRSLQERIRLHTHGVRNWGYKGDVIKLAVDLYGALDAAMIARHGFGATDVIEIARAVLAEFERKQGAHWEKVRTIIRASSVKKMAELYYTLVPDLVGTAKEFVAGLPGNLTPEMLRPAIIAHMDLRLDQIALFRAAEISRLVGRPEDVVAAVFRALSYKPGSLSETKPEHLLLDNPVWDRPGIECGDAFFIPIPQMIFSHIHRVMERLAKEAGLQTQLNERRAAFLEAELEAVFRKALPDAAIRSGVAWKENGQQFETDLLVTIDRVVVIAEAKSHRLTPQGLRGAPDRIKKHVRDMVLDPSIQSERLEEAILAARAGDPEAISTVKALGIDPDMADRVIRLSVTLDDLSVLSSAEGDFKKVGWVPAEHSLAPTILVSDLRCVADILDDQLLFLHYLSERAYLQKDYSLLADELDYLGLYLSTGFNLRQLHDEISLFVPTGMSAPIDRYYMGRDNGIEVPKPTMELRPLFRAILARLTTVKPPGWTLIGFHLLSCADPAEQKAIEKSLMKLRHNVRRNFRDPDHLCILRVHPPEDRQARVVFYLFPEQHRDSYRRRMESLATRAIEEDGLNACVVFARGVETWGRPFEAVLLSERS
ncbi:hypothetical protein RFN28_05310 [Mesorhizobium sp. VK24D]|uniref:NERD domain-containing protein n=1 Tax=Mesorhizobium album TaxID=3072314 RepID=A0ABU4XT64_9HYPH|nr:hypothetical protein [Mesorhizobium sp. VK24D]MDX8477900.1 hypothetical protein [Mesorhizobium sp. VK24D]